MAGIVAYGAYIPWHRMDRKLFARTWGGASVPGERAIAYHDEDSLTMAVEAALDCLNETERSSIDGLLFATTSAPYKEKQCSALMAIPLDLRRDIRTADVNTSLRSGTIALDLAFDRVASGRARNVLVTAADSRLGAPAGSLEQSLGDGAAAFLIGKENVIAEIKGSYSIADELAGTWRSHRDDFVRSWEDRMVLDEGYSKVMPEVMIGLMRQHGLSPEDFTNVVFDAPVDVRRHTQVAAVAGFEPSQVSDPFDLFLQVGLTGCAAAPMMLVSALEQANPGDRLLFAGSGDGADAFVLEITDAIRSAGNHRGIRRHLASKHMLTNYATYLRWRDIIPIEAARRPERTHIRLSAIWRERKQLLGLWGVKCRRCGTPQYDNGAVSSTPIHVCAVCHARDDFDEYNFKGRKARVFGFTHDNLAAAPDSPVSVTLVEFEGGGRAFFDLTDRDPGDVKVGMEVETTLRKVYFDRGISNYYWKARPIR